MNRCLLGVLVAILLASPLAAAVPAASDAEPAPRTLYLIRHGEYDHDDSRDEDVGRGLVPLGCDQARLIGERLRDLPVDFSSLQSSTMTRARETADIVAEYLPGLDVARHRDIRECTPPTWREDIMADLEEGDGEPCAALLESAFARLFRPAAGEEAHDVVVCHGNVIRWFVCRALDVEPMAWLGMSIANCSLTVIRIDENGRIKLVSFGDVGHLPPAMTTFPGGWAPYR